MNKQQFLLEVNHIIESGHNDIRLSELYDKVFPEVKTESQYAKQILLRRIDEYNKTVRDISKFRLWEKEVDFFCSIMEEYANQFKHNPQDGEEETAEQVNYGAMINPEILYPVVYTVMQSGEKMFEPRWMVGRELTEPQIKYLYDSGYFKGEYKNQTTVEAVKPDLGICLNCKKVPATTDYNGYKHFVCDDCNRRLNNEFDEEYR